MCKCTSIHMCNYMLTTGFWLRAHTRSHLRARSHLHTPNVDYTASERGADYTAKERVYSSKERVPISGAETGWDGDMADFSFIGPLQLHNHGALGSVDH